MSNRKLYPATLSNIQWQGNAESYTWQDANSVIKGNVRNSVKDTVLKLDALNKLLKGINNEAVRRIPIVSWIDDKTMFFYNRLRILYSDRRQSHRDTRIT